MMATLGVPVGAPVGLRTVQEKVMRELGRRITGAVTTLQLGSLKISASFDSKKTTTTPPIGCCEAWRAFLNKALTGQQSQRGSALSSPTLGYDVGAKEQHGTMLVQT
jgi:hypothetical protein